MKLIITFYLICLVFISSNTSIEHTASLGRKGANDSIAYVKNAIAFVGEVEGKYLHDSSFILYASPAYLGESGCWEEIANADNGLSKDEINFIVKGQYLSIAKWQKEWFPTIKLLDKDTLKRPGYDNPEAFLAFQKKYRNGVNSFSFPIFLRNYTYCLFYYNNICGSLCGYGVLNLYKRENGKWVVVKELCYWIS